MRVIRSRLWAGLAGLAVAVGLSAQDKKDNPEPAAPAGEEVGSGFRAYVVAEPRVPKEDVRDRVGKMQDLLTDHALEPTIAIFSRTIPPAVTHPLAAVIKR